MMEQFRSHRIAKLASKHSLDGIQFMYRILLQGMMDTGVLRQEDSDLLSMELVSPIALLIQMCDREPEREPEAMERIEALLRHFARVYGA